MKQNLLWRREEAIDAGDARGYFASQQASEAKMLAEYKPVIDRICELKKEKGAVVLAHTYQSGAVQRYVADQIGDSYGLSVNASETGADMILFCGVHFMAETAKILNPDKKVLLPSLEARCSLAVEDDAEKLRLYRQINPDIKIMAYINTTAAVKAYSDIVFTSSNRLKVFDALADEAKEEGARGILVMPDRNMFTELKKYGSKKGISVYGWDGTCVVHENIRGDEVRFWKRKFPGLVAAIHPESMPDAVDAADFVGSTTEIVRYFEDSSAKLNFVGTECEVSSALQKKHPEKQFIGSCTLCPYMKKIDLDSILWSLENEQYEITVPRKTADKARKALERMLEAGR